MEKRFLNQEIKQILEKLENGRKIQIEKELQIVNNPRTVGELLQELEKHIEEKSSLTTHFFKVIETLELEELFPYILNTIDKMDSSIFKEYAFQSLSAVSKDAEEVGKYVPSVLKVIEESTDYRVIYQGVVALYKMAKTHPQLESQLKEKRIFVNLSVIQDILSMLKHVDKWEPDFHKNSNVRTPLGDPDEFFAFASQFIAF
ncbi:hypothetical protein [Geosporobacter ferrireducens]|uniref:Condensin complex subunit 1 C-terminal domain-containing protein n=1 Tax=Geosporobacter ferrireducens TaxID=1424294 RepID=A0A1D8GE62_9FIRM|nr:hypothetical protein [Geosporobacter ferrireducens]AOT69203.1 hypothetical protein Gferi_06270 [Geosporobacter ferrireducens]MTI56881.1 hypothetical protein [Geosporobacter ferrireducens]